MAKREKWTEDDLDALPSGETREFERKSGLLFRNGQDEFLNDVAKALSAFANSGGGDLILGIGDNGVPDGLSPAVGRTSMRDWLEQKIPRLLAYRLSDFSVYTVLPAESSSRIPQDKVVIVISVGDSPLAPHQSVRDNLYYCREGGRSVPAPHFYLELLRQRKLGAVLEASLVGLNLRVPEGSRSAITLRTRLEFRVHNSGRVAASRWAVGLSDVEHYAGGRRNDYSFDTNAEVLEDLLPGLHCTVSREMTFILRPESFDAAHVEAEIHAVIADAIILCVLAVDTGPAQHYRFELKTVTDAGALAAYILRQEIRLTIR